MSNFPAITGQHLIKALKKLGFAYLLKKFPKRKHAPLETISLLSEELNR